MNTIIDIVVMISIYIYNIKNRRNKIVSMILKGYCKFTNSKLPMYIILINYYLYRYFKEDVSLYNYATTKSDKKKHLSKIPSE